ncbi:MAG: TonB family protein [Verrucomicrobiota bacterium]
MCRPTKSLTQLFYSAFMCWMLAVVGMLGVQTGDLQAAETSLFQPEPILTYFPSYPREHLLDGERGDVSLLLKVTQSGAVEQVVLEQASSPEFATTAMAAVKHWKFKPHPLATVESYPVRQTFRFVPNQDSFYSFEVLSMHRNLERPVIPLIGIRPEYPQELKDKRLSGFADVIITVNATGHVTRAEIEQVTHEAFVANALAAARQWHFKPVSPEEVYMENTGRRPDYISSDISKVKCRLTLLFSPQASKRQPLDLRLAAEFSKSNLGTNSKLRHASW